MPCPRQTWWWARVSLVLKADLRPGVTDGLTSKVETIERYLEP